MIWLKFKLAVCEHRRVLGALLVVVAAASSGCSQSSDARLTTFQQFVNGRLPIKEAVVFRQMFQTNGTLINREWWRFGYQQGTWFVQRLIPGTNGSTALVPRDSDICGASFGSLWTVDDKNLNIAPKDAAKGSAPETSGVFERSLLWSALSLGIPRRLDVLSVSEAPVQWDHLRFQTRVTSRRDEDGSEVWTTPTTGQLKLGESGVPSSAQFAGAGDFPGGTVTYHYARKKDRIPESFSIHFPGGMFSYRFLSLTLGSNDLATTDGYEPSLFADMNRPRIVTLFTNQFGYTQKDGESYPAFTAPAPKLKQPAPRLRRTNWFNTTRQLTLEGLHGKVVLLDFWSIYCVPCIEKLPQMEGLFQEFKKQGLVIIGVCLDWGNAGRAEQLLKDRNVSFPNLMDADLAVADYKTGYTAWNYAVHGVPSYALIGRSGNLVWTSENGVPPSESQVKELLDGLPTN